MFKLARAPGMAHLPAFRFGGGLVASSASVPSSTSTAASPPSGGSATPGWAGPGCALPGVLVAPSAEVVNVQCSGKRRCEVGMHANSQVASLARQHTFLGEHRRAGGGHEPHTLARPQT
jgi:hypothetical protein